MLRNFQALLPAYRIDTEIRAAVDLYERCYSLFMRLRYTLRLSAPHVNQLRQPPELPPNEQPPSKRALEQLRQELRQLAAGESWQRTTNQLESDWGDLKRGRRCTHGRGKLTRDFQTLPEDLRPLLPRPRHAGCLNA